MLIEFLNLEQNLLKIGLFRGKLKIYLNSYSNKYLSNTYKNFGLISISFFFELFYKLFLVIKISLDFFCNFLFFYLGTINSKIFLWFLNKFKFYSFIFSWHNSIFSNLFKEYKTRYIYSILNIPELCFFFNTDFGVKELKISHNTTTVGVFNSNINSVYFDYFIFLNTNSNISIYWFLTNFLNLIYKYNKFNLKKISSIFNFKKKNYLLEIFTKKTFIRKKSFFLFRKNRSKIYTHRKFKNIAYRFKFKNNFFVFDSWLKLFPIYKKKLI